MPVVLPVVTAPTVLDSSNATARPARANNNAVTTPVIPAPPTTMVSYSRSENSDEYSGRAPPSSHREVMTYGCLGWSYEKRGCRHLAVVAGGTSPNWAVRVAFPLRERGGNQESDCTMPTPSPKCNQLSASLTGTKLAELS